MNTSTMIAAKTLEDQLRHIAKVCGESATGPLRISQTVEELGQVWDEKYRVAAEDKSLSDCLIKTCGKGKHRAWFQRRYNAVQAFGGLRATCAMDHEAAVYAFHRVPESIRQVFMRRVTTEFIQNGRNPLTKPQVTRIAKMVQTLKSAPEPPPESSGVALTA